MTSLVWLGLGNLALATPLAAVAWLSGRFLRRPALTHGLWVLVLLKLVTPPLGLVPVGSIEEPGSIEPAAHAQVVIPEADIWERIAVAPAAIKPDSQTVEEARNEIALATPIGTDASHDDAATSDPNLNEAGAEPALPDASLPLPVAGPEAAQGSDSDAAHEENRFASAFRLWFLPIFGGVWLAGAIVFWVRVLKKSLCFQRLLAAAPAAPETVKVHAARLAAELGVRGPDVVFVPSAVSPLLWVSGRRAILVLPQTLFEHLEPEQQTTLLVHELAHWKRGDHWVRRLECLAGGLYWWCPLVWWAQAGVRQAEEECCDAWVTATVPGSARAYALALVETVDFLAALGRCCRQWPVVWGPSHLSKGG